METEQAEEERLLVANDESGFRRSQHKSMQDFEKEAEKLQDETITRNQERSEESKQNSSLRQRMWLSFLFLSGQFWEESTEPRTIWEKENMRAHMKGMVNGEDCAESGFFLDEFR